MEGVPHIMPIYYLLYCFMMLPCVPCLYCSICCPYIASYVVYTLHVYCCVYWLISITLQVFSSVVNPFIVFECLPKTIQVQLSFHISSMLLLCCFISICWIAMKAKANKILIKNNNSFFFHYNILC
jgi:hypothetical protein